MFDGVVWCNPLTYWLFGITHLELMFLLRRNQEVDLLKQELKTFPENFWVKMQILFLKLFSFGCFFLIFAVANKLPGFSISRSANAENFLKANIFLNCKYKCEYEKFSFKYICVVYYLKLCFYCLTWSVTDFRDFSS